MAINLIVVDKHLQQETAGTTEGVQTEQGKASVTEPSTGTFREPGGGDTWQRRLRRDTQGGWRRNQGKGLMD